MTTHVFPTDRTYPRICMVILNWNQADLTIDCLESVFRMDYPELSVLLVDNGSDDGTPERVMESYPMTEVLRLGHNVGYSAGNNVGIEIALERGADYVMLLNNDTIVAPDMLRILVEVAESHPSVAIVGPTMLYHEPADVIWGASNFVDWRSGTFSRRGLGERVSEALEGSDPEECDYIDSCAILIKRDAIDQIGLLDERFFINFDDIDWNTRARHAGFQVLYVPNAVIWHRVSAAMGQASPATTYYMTRNALLYFWKHGRGTRRIRAILLNLWRTLRTIAAWTVRPQYRSFRRARDANVRAIRDFLWGRFGESDIDFARTT